MEHDEILDLGAFEWRPFEPIWRDRKRRQEIAHVVELIGQEQERIRPNMQAIDRNTDLYNRYVKKFSDQEDRIEKLREELAAVEQQVSQAQASLDEYLMDLNLP